MTASASNRLKRGGGGFVNLLPREVHHISVRSVTFEIFTVILKLVLNVMLIREFWSFVPVAFQTKSRVLKQRPKNNHSLLATLHIMC